MKKLLILFMLFSIVSKAQEQKHKAEELSPGKNIVSFSPYAMAITAVGQDMPDISIGFSYERISNNGYIGLRLPVYASLLSEYYYFMPGIRLYPGKQGRAKYAIGPQVLIGRGKAHVPVYTDPWNNSTGVVVRNRSQFGFLIANSFNFTIARHVYVGMDLNFGIIYHDTEPGAVYNTRDPYLRPNTNNNSVNPATQLNFSMGYRF